MTSRRVIVMIVGAAGLTGVFWWTGLARRVATSVGVEYRRLSVGASKPVPIPTRFLVPASPYKNTRAGVKYIGDAACAGCHEEISDNYKTHPMGRSLGAAGDPSPDRPPIPAKGVSFERNGFTYEVRQQGEKIVHKETRRDGKGRELSDVEVVVQYALGSGTRGVSYLFERDGFLFQSPISWYSQEKKWDLAPGYGRENPHFGRPIDVDCLFCHSNAVEHISGTEYRYTPPTFRGHAIGCERCHGPGELHAADPGSAEATTPDLTIVNPSKLEPELRDSVCQQCHLLGTGRFLRAGREPFEYRPGLPLRTFFAAYSAARGDFRAVGHVEQSGESRCSTASGGKFACTSCHDPHRVPAESEKVAHYRGRCLTCHATRGCSAPAADRQRRGDDCVSCHMPRLSLSNIVHTAASDHRILRRPGSDLRPSPDPTRGKSAAPLVDFFDRYLTEPERRAAGRDLGIALVRTGETQRNVPGVPAAAGKMALPLLQNAESKDLPAREALGSALRMLGRPAESRDVFRSVLACAPRREPALRGLAAALTDLRDLPAARDAWRALPAVNPWRADDHQALALVLAEQHDWPAAVASCHEALRLNPALIDARALLVRVLLWSGDSAQAREEFDRLVEFAPASRVVWEEWYKGQQEQVKKGSGAVPGQNRSSGK